MTKQKGPRHSQVLWALSYSEARNYSPPPSFSAIAKA